MYFITIKRMLEVCFSAHPNIQYRAFLYLGWKFPPEIEKTEGFHPRKIRFCHPFARFILPPGCVEYGVRKRVVNGCKFGFLVCMIQT